MRSIESFIEGIPKVELHMHIEGSLEPKMLWDKAQGKGIKVPYKSIAEIKKAYNFGNLQDFLDLYYRGMSVLQTERDFYDLTLAYLKKSASQNVLHTEIFFDPQGHTSRGVSFDTVMKGITRAQEDGKKTHGINSLLIMHFLRHLDEQDAFKTLAEALPYKKQIVGVGLDSSELGHPPSKFTRVFAAAQKEGFKLVAHAGEEGPPAYVWEALNLLRVNRIDHGNRSLEDKDLVGRLVGMQMPLTMCPLSNLKLRGVQTMEEHPLKKMLALGIKATVNSDDPAYFGGYMNENLMAVTKALGLTKTHIVKLVRNSIDASFLGDADKNELRYRVDTYVAAASRTPGRNRPMTPEA